jgi:hypothetical protein
MLLRPLASLLLAFYLGRWKIESAAVAPWSSEPGKPEPLVGRIVAITPKAITGPKPLACAGPHYEVKDYPADMLFQGAFGEMHTRDKSADPAKIAAKVGFQGTTWKTVETGCANELDYHFLDPTHAAIGLNNYIYFLTKLPTEPRPQGSATIDPGRE